MADKDIKLRIDAAVETAEAAKSLGQLRKALLEIQTLQAEIGDTSGENFDKLAQASTQASKKLAETRDAIGDIQDRTRTLEGTPVERLTGSFDLLRESIFTLDFDKARIGAEGLLNTFTPVQDGKLVTGFAGIGGAVSNLGGVVKDLGSTFLSLGKALLTNPLFLLAAIITAIVIAVVKLLDSLGLLKPILDAIKAAIGFVVDAFKALTDWLGFTTNAQNDYAEATIKGGEQIKKAIQDEGAEREKLLGLVEGLTDEEIAAIERKTGIQIANEKSIYDIKQETLMATRAQLDEEINALYAIEEAGGELTEEQKKQLDERLEDYKKTNAAIRENEIAKNAAIVQMNKKSADTLRDLQLRNITDEIEKNNKLIEINKNKEIADINAQIAKAKKIGADTKDLEAAKVEIEKFYAGETKKLQAQKAKEDADRRKEQYEDYKSAIGKELKALQDNEKAKVVSTEEGSAERLKAEIAAIDRVEEFQKKNAKALGLTQAQLTIIYQENLDKKAKLQEDFDNKVLEAANKQKLVTAELDVLRAKTDEERLTASISQIEAQRDIQLSNAELTADEREKIELEAANQISAINQQLTDIQIANNQKRLDSDRLVAETKLSQAQFDAERTRGTTEQEIAEVENLKNLQIEALEAQRQAELANVELTENEKAAIEENYRQQKLQAEEEATKKVKELKQQELGAQLQIGAQSINAISSLTDAVFSIRKSGLEKGSAEELKAAKKEFEIKKKLNIGAAIISTIQGVVNALTAQTVIPEPFGTILKAVNAVAVGAAGAANIAKISASKFEGGTPPTGSVPTPSGGGDIPGADGGGVASTFSPTQFFGLGQGASSGGGLGAQPQRVYVTEGDITSTQNKVRVIEDRAVIN